MASWNRSGRIVPTVLGNNGVDIPPWPNCNWPSRTTAGPHQVKIHPDHPDHELLTWDDWALVLRYYYAFATLIDSQIGRLMQHLEQAGQIENTTLDS